ncbi:hypothetical protein BH721_01435 [Clostridium baratii]|uniref:sigma factor-like helix-turn-helix DNA-binding protein n=1 Tax=Clostridium baratii TaxID=1561 RepID=UPI0009A4483F|nr:sigma factor-like helix-turn-helix DNA-binding protein [Clostridium baratii]OPF51532.1 hypothetical protein A1M12_03040 [Clostridium baratii]OPF55397.1 hypothetical protein BH721_01435 [Clostridium baratii]OPF57680.1 hypothetical protein BH724_08690 [Clostridium baratii]OPF60222.1 hypothetical protein BH725_06490 [Clostridium baratii]
MDKDLLKKTEELLKNYNILESQIKVLSDDEKIKEKKELKERIDIAIDSLDEVEKKVLELKYINKRKLSWKEIAKTMNFSACYCRQKIKERALNQITKIIFINEI